MQDQQTTFSPGHEQIPFGPYCYTIESITSQTNGLPAIKTRPCGYFSRTTSEKVRCNLLNVDDDILLADGCKICGIREDLV